MLYDPRNKNSILNHAQKLVNKTLKNFFIIEKDYNMKNKGQFGHLLEEKYFEYKINSDTTPDFNDVGIELKSFPAKKNKNGTISAKERMVLTKISLSQPVVDKFEDSHLMEKCKNILIILYMWEKNIPIENYKIIAADIFSILDNEFAEDLLIIKEDYKYIVSKIKEGKYHELSEGDTFYLGACTKAKNGKIKSLQYYKDKKTNQKIEAKPRAFCFKTKYMTYLINSHLLKKNSVEKSKIIKNISALENLPFEEYMIKKIEKYINKNVDYLGEKFSTNSGMKNFLSKLTFDMLGVKSNKVEEFIKADIEVKIIKINKNNKLNEHMSFQTIKLAELITQNWENSWIYQKFSNKKYLFSIFKEDKYGKVNFKGIQLWNMPYFDLENDCKNDWNKIINTINKGLNLKISNGKVINKLPNSKDSKIIHLRPHAISSAYKFEKFQRGNLKRDGDTLPDGRIITKQSFWINKDYLLNQINKKFIN